MQYFVKNNTAPYTVSGQKYHVLYSFKIKEKNESSRHLVSFQAPEFSAILNHLSAFLRVLYSFIHPVTPKPEYPIIQMLQDSVLSTNSVSLMLQFRNSFS